MKIYTKTGDQGETGLLAGIRVSKSHRVIETCGCLDETNCLIGMVLSEPVTDSIRTMLTQIQNQDPLNPMESGDFLSQMAQFGTVNGITELQSSFSTLANAMQSMLQLSNDIGIMANRILEMADLILAMADNIGLQADQILLTQQLQNANIAATQAAILSAQTTSIILIAGFGL